MISTIEVRNSTTGSSTGTRGFWEALLRGQRRQLRMETIQWYASSASPRLEAAAGFVDLRRPRAADGSNPCRSPIASVMSVWRQHHFDVRRSPQLLLRLDTHRRRAASLDKRRRAPFFGFSLQREHGGLRRTVVASAKTSDGPARPAAKIAAETSRTPASWRVDQQAGCRAQQTRNKQISSFVQICAVVMT